MTNTKGSMEKKKVRVEPYRGVRNDADCLGCKAEWDIHGQDTLNEIRSHVKKTGRVNDVESRFDIKDFKKIDGQWFVELDRKANRVVTLKYIFQQLLKANDKKSEEREKKYHELLLAVGNKYKGETRHQTALRYIRQAETSDSKAKVSQDNLLQGEV